MGLFRWMMDEHPFFRDTREQLLQVIGHTQPTTLDDLTVRSRRPARTVILVLEDMDLQGAVRLAGDGTISLSSYDLSSIKDARDDVGSRDLPSNHRGDLYDRYLSLSTTREQPALLWGQRRLVPASAVKRAEYVLDKLGPKQCRVLFLGDDDLVSPLVAAVAPHLDITVIDIDRAVLDRVVSVSAAMGARADVEHADISAAMDRHSREFAAVVCDPFPSGDGSFESMFWARSPAMLVDNGTLFTTIAPSHKPLGYSMGAVRAMVQNGFCPYDIQMDFGRYEVFDFELSMHEESFLQHHRLKCSVSHTKSLVSARLIARPSCGEDLESTRFDFDRWVSAAASHYLTVQAGVQSQEAILKERGAESAQCSISRPSSGIQRLRALLPAEVREKSPAQSAELEVADIVDALSEMGANITSEDRRELGWILADQSPTDNSQDSQLGLAVRAIESWERFRFED